MVTFNTDLSGGTFTNSDLKGEYGYEPSNNINSNLSSNSQEEAQQFFSDVSQFMDAGVNPNLAIKWAGDNQANKSLFSDNPSDVSANQSPTYNPVKAMADASPLTSLIKGIFGVDEFTGSFQQSRDELNDPHGDSSLLGQNNAMAMMGAGQNPMLNPMPNPILTPTEPQPSPNPEGLYLRPNMLNQVPDSYSQAFKDANQAYMQNMALRPSDFKEKIDLRAFEKLQGLLDE